MSPKHLEQWVFARDFGKTRPVFFRKFNFRGRARPISGKLIDSHFSTNALFWMSFPEIGLFHAPKFWNWRFDEFSRNRSSPCPRKGSIRVNRTSCLRNPENFLKNDFKNVFSKSWKWVISLTQKLDIKGGARNEFHCGIDDPISVGRISISPHSIWINFVSLNREWITHLLNVLILFDKITLFRRRLAVFMIHSITRVSAKLKIGG